MKTIAQKLEAQNIKIPLMKSTFYHAEETQEALAEFVRTAKQLSMGKECLEFETAFARKQQRKHAVFVTSGSMANLILIQALMNLGRLHRGDRVGFSALTWATNVMPLMQLGLVPVALDCELSSLNTSSRLLEPQLGTLKAFFATNVLGFSADLDRIRSRCAEEGVLLLEDNCESLGSVLGGTLLGNFGVASTFSFFVGHHFSTIEGGMICTDDEELADMLIMVRAHGWDRTLAPAKQQALRAKYNVGDFQARYTFYESAFNGRPCEINGFLGKTQLGYLDEIIQKRVSNFARFHAATLGNPDAIYPLDVSHMERVSNFAMPIVCRSVEQSKVLEERFVAAGVEIRPVIAGDITQHPFYTKQATGEKCATAALVHAQGFYFPNHPELTDDEVTLLCSLLAA